MNIGTQIHALRKRQGITQETLAAEMGVTVGAVSKWENDITFPDILMLCNLADYFHVTTDELLGRSQKSCFMICDDAPFIRDALRELLEREGYHCAGLAENGAQLHTLIDEKLPDILFLDIHLAEENGLTLLKEIKQKKMPIRIIMLTADDTEETRQTAVAYGADAYIIKPFLPQQIIAMLDKQINLRTE